jgi:hypothetical protein
LEKRAEQVQQKAKQARQEIDRADSGARTIDGRFRGLLGRAGVKIGEEDVKFGSAFKFGRQGFGLQETFKKGTGPGGIGALNTALWGGVALHGAANMLERMAEIRRELKDKTLSEAIREATLRLPETVIQSVGGNVAGRIVKSAYTTATGNEFVVEADESFLGKFNYAMGQIFGYDNALDAQIAAQARVRRNQLEKEIKDEIQAKRREAAEDAVRKIDEAVESQIGRLKTDVVRPKDVRLNREQNREFQRRHDEAAERRLRRQGQEQKEQAMSVLNGEGR